MNQVPSDKDFRRGVFAISVAADMTALQIQNIRVYERRGLLEPDRSAGGTRLYSRADIETLLRIRDLLAEGLNIAGIARVMALEAEVTRLRREIDLNPPTRRRGPQGASQR